MCQKQTLSVGDLAASRTFILGIGGDEVVHAFLDVMYAAP